ncbi:TetR/AcrR family transcriptional regulator [Paenibacillus sp. LHD-38]|uniref:TetR/AcrR family transcriptional regulator n=1 Tax=Paenibacillus sp. LHD-38 TaxID=3072143 RepID=UPI00281054B3|nr:TetR/AcrR family transcriptional regulator [Paenibacillus sp. LHD-38]MDQ8735610.1 TetR/AcrR family transcriptional regulator [Paenibacillus sp. LHD-38]
MHKKIFHTKQALRQALFTLIETIDIQEITVSQICREANINRTTFYKYFALPIDILNEYVEEVSEQALRFIRKQNGVPSKSDTYTIMLDICRIYYENKQLMKIYMACNKTLIPMLQRIFVEFSATSLKENSLKCFLSGGVSAIIFQWSLEDYKQLPEEIATILSHYILQLSSPSGE